MGTGISDNQLITRRLCYTKGLLRIGINHLNNRTEVDIAQSLLSFDNSLEMMLKIVLDFMGIRLKGNIYVPILIEKVAEIYPKTPVADLNTLHNLRNSIQHNGFIPASSQAQANKILVESFFKSVSIDKFNIPWEQVSLGILINNPTVRELYLKADEALNNHKFQDAAFNVIAAFEVAMIFEMDRLWPFNPERPEAILQLDPSSDVIDFLLLRLDPKKYLNHMEIAVSLRGKHSIKNPADLWEPSKILDAVVNSSKDRVVEAESGGLLEKWLGESMDFVIDSVLTWEATYRPSLLEAIRDKDFSALNSLIGTLKGISET